MSTLPARTDISGTPSNATAKLALTSIYDFVAQRLAAGTSGAGAATNAELALARNSLQFTNLVGVAAAATTDIGGVASVNVEITGASTTITSFGTAFTGGERTITTTNSQTITNNANISTGFGSDVTTVAGESFRVVPNAAGTQWLIQGLKGEVNLARVLVSSSVANIQWITEWLPNFSSYSIEFKNTRLSVANAQILLRLRRNGAFASGASEYVTLFTEQIASTTTTGTILSSSFPLTGGSSNASTHYEMSGFVQISTDSRVPSQTHAASWRTRYVSTTGPSWARSDSTALLDQSGGTTAPITGIQLFPNSGNITQGTFILRGIR